MRKIVLGAAAALVLVAAPFAFAHSNGHESRTVAECEKLPGTATAGERGQCLSCVQRPVKHHYHPDYPPGKSLPPRRRQAVA